MLIGVHGCCCWFFKTIRCSSNEIGIGRYLLQTHTFNEHERNKTGSVNQCSGDYHQDKSYRLNQIGMWNIVLHGTSWRTFLDWRFVRRLLLHIMWTSDYYNMSTSKLQKAHIIKAALTNNNCYNRIYKTGESFLIENRFTQFLVVKNDIFKIDEFF